MSISPTKLILQNARKSIENEDNWVQNAWKAPGNNGAIRRCCYQAVHDAAGDLGLPADKALKSLSRILTDGRRSPRKVIPRFNDNAKHKDVLALLDMAIANA